MTATPTTPVAPARGLRVQGMPWRQWLRTTPGRLRAASAILLLALLALRGRHHRRHRGAESGRRRRSQTKSAPELVAIEKLYGNLADADATASTIFLRAGAEPSTLRTRYLDDLHRRGPAAHDGRQGCRLLSTGAGGAADDRRISCLATRGWSSTARANTRLGHPGRQRLPPQRIADHAREDPARRDHAVPPDRAPPRRQLPSGTSTSTVAVVVDRRRRDARPPHRSCRSTSGVGRTGSSTWASSVPPCSSL